MEASDLMVRRGPLERKYSEDPAAARVVFRSRGSVDPEGVACRVETRHGVTVTGLHRATGGTGADRAAEDMLLEALVGCAGVTLKAIAVRRGISLASAEIEAEGSLDFRGTMGIADDAPVGFSAIRLTFRIASDADDATLEGLIAATRAQCVVFQTLTCAPELIVSRV